MALLSERMMSRVRAFVTVTNWAGTVIMPLLLFWYGQRLETKIDAEKAQQEQAHKQDEELARSTALLANVAPMLFSNDTAPQLFALQIVAPGSTQIPAPIQPLLLEVVTLFGQKNPSLGDLAISVLTTKLTPAEIKAAQAQIPANVLNFMGQIQPEAPQASPPGLPNVQPVPPSSTAVMPPPPPPAVPQPVAEAPAPQADVAAVTQDILDASYNVIIFSARDQQSAISFAANATKRLHTAGSSLAACWKHPTTLPGYFGVAVGNGLSLVDAQTRLHEAQKAGFSDAFLRRVNGNPSPCTAA